MQSYDGRGIAVSSGGAPTGSPTRLVLDCVVCYIFSVIVILLAWPKYFDNATRDNLRNFGVTDKRTLGVFAGVVPFTVAAIFSVFVPLTVRYVRVSRMT